MTFPVSEDVWVIDTFCDHRYSGNPAAVFLLKHDYPADSVLQSAAARIALPTTAFVLAESEYRYVIRWFTPQQELNLCGHATIAAAAVLYRLKATPSSRRLYFETQMGTLRCELRSECIIALSLPAIGVDTGPPPLGLEEALGMKVVVCAQSVDDIVIELESQSAVAELAPDLLALQSIPCRGYVVTALSEDPDADFVSRAFFPALGVDEDQVCVSAHCKLTPFWCKRLSKQRLTAVQLSSRGGLLQLEMEMDGERVMVAGSARLRRKTTFGAEAKLAHNGLYRA